MILTYLLLTHVSQNTFPKVPHEMTVGHDIDVAKRNVRSIPGPFIACSSEGTLLTMFLIRSESVAACNRELLPVAAMPPYSVAARPEATVGNRAAYLATTNVLARGTVWVPG